MYLNKNVLAGALVALGKLISRTSERVLYRSLLIEKLNDKMILHTWSQDESFEFSCPSDGETEFSKLVSFEEFRNAVRSCRSKEVTLEVTAGGVLLVDGRVIPEVKCEIPALVPVPEAALSVDLPENFIPLLCQAATVASRSDPRPVLCGIHLDQTGITSTNGKELLHIPVEWQMQKVNLPLPLALINTKSAEAGKMWLWEKEKTIFFKVVVGSWCWRGKGVEGIFPDWQQILTPKPLPCSMALKETETLQFQTFLKGLPDMPPNNPVRLSVKENFLTADNGKGEVTTIQATASASWKDFSVTVNKEYLLRALLLGHRTFKFGKSREPFRASGGVGEYTAMPLIITSLQPAKEENTMNNTGASVREVSMPPVVQIPKNENTVTNPMDELVAAIEEFRTKLKVLSDEAAVLSRKAKEVSLAQKQKERDFIQAKRAIERIRMAI